MPRVARVVVPGLPHHVTHRGNRRQAIFFGDDDRQRYLAFLLDYASHHGLDLWAYCLMTNHVHLLAVPHNKHSLARAIGRAHMMYARRINAQRGWTGHLWANRFYSCPVEPTEARAVARYIELNPVRGNMTAQPDDYAWSSARAHCHGTNDPVLAESRPDWGSSAAWRKWLREGIEESEKDGIRASVSTGVPFGSSAFLARLEDRLGRRLRRRRYRRRTGRGQ